MSFNKKTVEDVDVAGKRVLVRVDFNVPQDESGAITDDRRIRAALPTIQYLVGKGAKVILASHLGRPKGGPTPKYSLSPVAERLGSLLGKPVPLAPDSVGPEVKALVDGLKDGDVLLLENVRFYPEEEKNDPAYAQKLASLADVYVNDAFGTATPRPCIHGGRCSPSARCGGLSAQERTRLLGQHGSRTPPGPSSPFWAARKSRTRSP